MARSDRRPSSELSKLVRVVDTGWVRRGRLLGEGDAHFTGFRTVGRRAQSLGISMSVTERTRSSHSPPRAIRVSPDRSILILVDSNLSPEEVGEIGLAKVGADARIDRRAAFFNPGSIRLGDHVRVDAFSVLAGGSEELIVGSYVHIGAACYLSAGDGGIRISDFCTLAPRVSVHGHSDDYRGGTLTGGVVPAHLTGGMGAPIVLEEHVIVGSGSVILPGVILGFGAAVGALTVVRRSVGSGVVVGGNPASTRGTPRSVALQRPRILGEAASRR